MSSPTDALSTILDPRVKEYIDTLHGAEDPLLDRMESYAAERGFPLIGRASGRWLTLLAESIGARRVFEVGSGFGYSAFFFAQAVGVSGEVIGADRDAWEIESHREIYSGHPFSSRIYIHQGEALEVLDTLPGEFDIFLLDCDKKAYSQTLEHVLPRLRPGGLVLADNVLWGGRTTQEPAEDDVSTRGLRDFNRLIHAHPELQSEILPVGDGLAVCRKRSA